MAVLRAAAARRGRRRVHGRRRRGARARLRELGQPETFEWVHETAPSLIGAIRATGLDVLEVPLLVLDRSLWRAPEPPASVTLRRLDPDDAALAAALAVAEVGFGAPGTAPDPRAAAEREAAIALAAGCSSTCASGCGAARA